MVWHLGMYTATMLLKSSSQEVLSVTISDLCTNSAHPPPVRKFLSARHRLYPGIVTCASSTLPSHHVSVRARAITGRLELDSGCIGKRNFLSFQRFYFKSLSHQEPELARANTTQRMVRGKFLRVSGSLS
eukprot:sb/3475176/